jgi:CheY-like chemotaxis protein
MKDNQLLPAREPASKPLQSQTNPPPHILVVDDDSDVRQLSLDVLAAEGYEVDGVKDGADGWEALQTYDYDLIITDNQMPRMTGVEMLEKLRSAHMSLPVIMATRNLPKYEFACKPWLKPDATLERPFSNDDLLEAVRKVLHTDNDAREQTAPPSNWRGQPLPNGLRL